MNDFNPQRFIIMMAVLIVAITIHEFAHAITADRLGDPTPRKQGRISLFPIDHLDPLGTLLMVLSSLTGVGFGWGKPVMTNPMNFRKPVRDSAIVAIAGPVSNILQSIIFVVLFRVFGVTSMDGPMGFFLVMGVVVNLTLAFFNMLPIGPLDGHWVIQALLPRDQAERYYRWNLAYGGLIFLGTMLLAPGLVMQLINPARMAVMRYLFSFIS